MSYTNGLDKPDLYFNTVLYTGDNTSNRSITGVGFQPDLTWHKTRNQAYSHSLFDAVRGAGKRLVSNQTSAEGTTSDFVSFDSDGVTISQGGDQFNASGDTEVLWNWLGANGTASNTDGSITSTVSANTTSGFSIVSYTGTGANATVGHGLGVVPACIILKNRDDGTSYWRVGHQSLTWNNEIFLNDSAGTNASSGAWNNTAPTSTVFSLGTGGYGNASGQKIIAYCFAEKKGFSKFGKYTGNGSSDGTFVYTGFKPSFVITKCSSTSSSYTHWGMWDNKRSPFNVADKQLASNLSDEENSANIGGQYIDMLSNGFKCRTSESAHNQSGVNYIYMAFAENPLVGTNNIPATAR